MAKRKIRVQHEAGRPLKTIDWDKADQLFVAGCTGSEVAAYFSIHPETFYERIKAEKGMGVTQYAGRLREKGDSLLRAAQFEEAIKKRDRGMLIWLGKNRLGQTDKQEVKEISKTEMVKIYLPENTRDDKTQAKTQISITND